MFAKFMVSSSGRALRVVAGLATLVAGYTMHSTPGYTVAAFGLLPLAAGVFDWCLFAPFFGLPFSGQTIRRR